MNSWISLLPVSAAAALLLAACGGPAEFERPVMDMPDGTARSSPVGKEWWRIFHDGALNRLEEKAVAHNRDLVRAAALVDQASALAAQAGSSLMPQAALQAEGKSQELSEGERYMDNLPDRARDLWSMSGVLSYEVDLWGKLRARTEAARAELLASAAARDAVYLRLTAEVASAYIDVRTWEEKCLIIRRVHASYEQTCAMYEKRFTQGQYPELALRRVQAERSKTLAQLKMAENELSRSESVLSVLVGDSPRKIMAGTPLRGGNPGLLASPPPIPAGIPGDMIERRPDICELESLMKAAFYGKEAARADRFPSLVLTGKLGHVSARLNELLNQSSRSYDAGGGILQTLFDGGRKRAAVRTASAECEAVRAAYEQAVLDAFREIRDALVERRKSTEIYEATRQEVEYLHRGWDIASRQYEAGYVGLMDALDTHRSLLSGELDMADAARMRLNAIVKFCKALGGGWERRPGPRQAGGKG